MIVTDRAVRYFLKALSGTNSTFEYFKKQIKAHLEKMEKEESEVKKSIFYADGYHFLIKGRALPVGTIKTWKGKKYIKRPDLSWARKYDKEERGVKSSLSALKKKVDMATTSQELLEIVLNNRDRFSDAEGHPLPFVQELSGYVRQQSDKVDSGNTKGAEEKKQQYQEAAERRTADREKKKQELQSKNQPELTERVDKKPVLELESTVDDPTIKTRKMDKQYRGDKRYTKGTQSQRYSNLKDDYESGKIDREFALFAQTKIFPKLTPERAASVVDGQWEVKREKPAKKQWEPPKISGDVVQLGNIALTQEDADGLKQYTVLRRRENQAFKAMKDRERQYYAVEGQNKGFQTEAQHKAFNEEYPKLQAEYNNAREDADKYKKFSPLELLDKYVDQSPGNSDNAEKAYRQLVELSSTTEHTKQVTEPEVETKPEVKAELNERLDSVSNNLKVWYNTHSKVLDAEKKELEKEQAKLTKEKDIQKKRNIASNMLALQEAIANREAEMRMYIQAGMMVSNAKMGSNDPYALRVRHGENPLDLIQEKAKREAAGDTSGTAPESNTLNQLQDKYQSAKSADGEKDSISVGDETVTGHWKLVEAETPTASHNETTFQQTKGFPTNADGSTINDRDYERDTAAQEAVVKIAGNYDARALSFDSPVTVTKDGIVISGNNRTMSSKIAAKKGTDAQYIEALKNKAGRYGFTPETIAHFEHPRMVFELDKNDGYSTEQFAKFNQSEKKAMDPVESAVKISKTIKMATIEPVAQQLSAYDTMGELYADKKAINSIFATFRKDGIVSAYDTPRYVTPDGITGAGKEFLETVLIGSIVNEHNIRRLNKEGGKEIRQKLVRALAPLVENKSLSNGYTITNELNESIDIVLQCVAERQKTGGKFSVDDIANQQMLFGEPPSAVAVAFAKRLDTATQINFANFVDAMEMGLVDAAHGQVEVKVGNAPTKEAVLERALSMPAKVTKKPVDDMFSPEKPKAPVPAVEEHTELAAPPVDTAAFEQMRQKYQSAPAVDGESDTISVGDETVSGHWKLVEAETPTASHDERTFNKTRGFPTNADGSTINDRDYERDIAAQEAVIKIGSNYDARALSFDSPVTVTKDGVVISGNNRTMSSKIAARRGTDTKYRAALQEKAGRYGFSPEDIGKFEHPRMVFELDNNDGYSTDQFAKFNQSDKKATDPIESAVKVSKTIKMPTVQSIATKMEDFDTMGDLYANTKAVNEIFGTLRRDGIIGEYDVPQYVTNNGITGAGKEFLETVLIGSVVNEDNLRHLSKPGGKSIRQKLVRALTPLVHNKSFKNEYSITHEFNSAVNMVLQCIAESERTGKKQNLSSFAQQGMLNGEKPDKVTVEFAKKIEGDTQKGFAEFMQTMNGQLEPAANGEVDIFLGEVESKKDILDRILRIRKAIRQAWMLFKALRYGLLNLNQKKKA
ncbi:hypothetical protein FACS1894172_15580 [Spirochaetia bacterium]|nr:hypothetical protein FACS1894164_04170 [Spirochaetia bacterium]GHU34793.1 hypothetical protein FACS1894172_15580 [Spirochaetia bacterium]